MVEVLIPADVILPRALPVFSMISESEVQKHDREVPDFTTIQSINWNKQALQEGNEEIGQFSTTVLL